MKWHKGGLIFSLSGRHAQMPTVEQHDDGTMTVYFSTRDEKNRSLPMCFRTRQDRPGDIIEFRDEPLFRLGIPGTFDDSGVMPSCAVGNALYYVGWSLRVTVPYFTAIGAAINLTRLYNGALLGYGVMEPWGCTTPYVIREHNLWKMWYASYDIWEEGEPSYHLRYATSEDGSHWNTHGILWYEGDKCFCRPSMFRFGGGHKMVYSYRHTHGYRTDRTKSYRLGLAASDDMLSWRQEDIGIDVSESGWDSEMIAYGTVYEFDGKVYMLYNGNGFGKSGIGYAILEDEG